MEIKHISAQAGQPSTFWKGASGNWYLTKAEAETDNTSRAVNPKDYELKKSFWNAHQKQIITCAAIVGCLLAIYMAYKFKDKLFKMPKKLL